MNINPDQEKYGFSAIFPVHVDKTPVMCVDDIVAIFSTALQVSCHTNMPLASNRVVLLYIIFLFRLFVYFVNMYAVEW